MEGMKWYAGEVVDNVNIANDSKLQIKMGESNFYQFYLNGNHIPDFDCRSYEYDYDTAGKVKGVFLTQDYAMGYGNLLSGKLTVPFDYLFLKRCFDYRDWLVAEKTVHKMVITNDNKHVTELYYEELQQVNYDNPDKLRPLIVSRFGGGSYFFLYLEKDSSSKERYDLLEPLYTLETTKQFLARRDGKYGLIDAANKQILPLEYDALLPIGIRFLKTEKGKQFGIYDKHRDFKTEIVYDNVLDYFNLDISKSGEQVYIFLVEKNGQLFYVDNFGKEFVSK